MRRRAVAGERARASQAIVGRFCGTLDYKMPSGTDILQRRAWRLRPTIKFAEMLCRFDVAPRPASDVVLFVKAELTPDFSGRTEHERASREESSSQ